MRARDITRVSMFAGLAVCAAMMVRFAGSVVPFSLLPLVSVLCGCLLGRRLGAMAMGVYAVMGLVGLPVFATAPFGGPAYVLRPTFGFIPGFVAGAYLSGWVSDLTGSRGTRGRVGLVLGSVLGIFGIYAVGLPYLWFAMNFIVGKAASVSAVVKMGLTPFMLPDILKAIVAGVVSAEVARRVPNPDGLASKARGGS